MNKERCLICKFHGKKSDGVLENELYQSGSVRTIHLCYVHSLELFKIGQTRFLMKHYDDFSNHGLDPDRFFEKKSYAGRSYMSFSAFR